ncbi:type VI secretion system protein IglI family protein [Lentisphaerota bacterium ZTH]|nr:hypothetical protein JYG24_04425 [Lentisphaerota bacterium]WET07246.1 type VI secretion system protein IglI family protein [Lentisphaerota bacterium ZTH]
MSNTVTDDQKEIQAIDSLDFDEINSLVNDLKFAEANMAIEELGDAGLYDIRTLFYLVYSRIHCDSLDNLVEHLEVACAVLEDREINQLQPQKHFEKHLDGSLTWFCNTLESNFKYRIREREFEYLDFEPIEKKFLHLGELLKDYLDFNAASYTAKLKSLLGGLSEKEEEEEEDPEESADHEGRNNLLQQYTFSGPASSKWQDLQNRISTFIQLVQDGRSLDAALFFKDIQEKINNFDPREYFPEVFYPMYDVMNNEFESILRVINYQQNSLQWHVAEQKYRIDSAMLAENNNSQPAQFSDYLELEGYLRNKSAPQPPQNSNMGGGYYDGGAQGGGYPGMGGGPQMDEGNFGDNHQGFNQDGGMPGMYDQD